MKTTTFFATHPVFTYDEFAAFAATHGSGNVNTLTAALKRYTGNGQIMRIRRGLYASVPPGQTPETTDPDPYLVASRLAPDAALAYHTALQFRGRAYSVFNTFILLTDDKVRPFTFRGSQYRAVPYPKQLAEESQQGFGIETLEIAGLDVRIASFERTLVGA